MQDEQGQTSEEYMQAVTIGERKPHRGPVELVDYDPEWPALFRREEERIRDVLAVADSTDEEAYVPALEDAGYVLRIREPDWFEHRLLKDQDPSVNLHVFSAGCPEIDRMLRFRDRLRTNDADRELYARAKRELAEQNWEYVQNYADAKT